MLVKEKLEKYQPIAYRIICNEFKNKTLTQAFLLSGEKGSPVFETAYFIAKSLVCENEIACEQCVNCLRIDEGNYTDLIVVDGTKESIKKKDIEIIQDRFSKSAIEEKGKKIYLINDVENTSKEAINSLLKFLEEPYDDVYAILTTTNLSKVLPTIISRCQVIRINKLPKDELIKEIESKLNVSHENCEILASYYNSVEEIEGILKENNFLTMKDLVIESMEALIEHDNPNYLVETEVMPLIKDKISAKLYLSLLELFIKDIINLRNNKKIIYEDQAKLIDKCNDRIKCIEKKLEIVENYLSNLESNANICLLLDSLYYSLAL